MSHQEATTSSTSLPRPRLASMTIPDIQRAFENGITVSEELVKLQTYCWNHSVAHATGNTPSDWSSVGSGGKGIFVAEQDPRGCSSGSAVAVALGLVPVALATETQGSNAAPACSAEVVGLKPTSSVTSRHVNEMVRYDAEDLFVKGNPVDGPDHMHLLRPQEGTDFQLACTDDALK
ncbi:uncharacterized protein RSE6_08611 [Rhynchosporium secalis]|uniref:Amidase domain-containing protein n=1 Tax=Rhynchosporium secalis TaxID=38038 RepID=A0A1E1MFV0_RHYSE|nr:uncharacterized protein RSE6_08611 [Rhynchosporium secalis]